MMPAPDTVVYAYAIVTAAEALPGTLAELRGVGDGPVRLVGGEDDGIVAVLSPVPAEDFREDALMRHLEDLDWLETVARAHHDVVAALSAVTTVLPLRLATVYLDEAGLRQALDAGREGFRERLAHLAARIEWGVKVYVEATPPEPSAEPARDPALTPGRAYLRNRRVQRDRHEDTYRAAEQAAERIDSAARRWAVDWARHRVQTGELAHGQGENVLNDAYLVPEDQAESFRQEILRAADGLHGVRVEVSGPWAPYSFAAPAEADPAEATPPEAAPAEADPGGGR